METMTKALLKILEGRSLSYEESGQVFEGIMTGQASPIFLSSFLTALRVKGETVEEIAGAAKAMRAACISIPVKTAPEELLDTCGTGGDKSGTFNISTAVSILAAGLGCQVAKHGNRSMSSKSGAADVLEVLGIKIDNTPEIIANQIDEIGLGFIFAPLHHPAMKHAVPVRKELGFRTIFNLLGPLSNPAGAKRQLIGVFSPSLTQPMAEVLKRLETNRAFVVSSLEGMDEVSPSGITQVSELKNNAVHTWNFNPEAFGFKLTAPADLASETPNESAGIIREVLSGNGKAGARQAVLLNTGFALVASGKTEELATAFKLAETSLDNGAGIKIIEALSNASPA